MKIKTIDITAKEWFDKVNGNSYLAGIVTINYGMKTQQQFTIPFQYGYGDYYTQAAKEVLTENKVLKLASNELLWRFCEENKIILRKSIHRNQRKRDVLRFIS